MGIALCNIKQGEYDQAVEHCKAALQYDPLNGKALLRIAQALQYINPSEARIFARKAAKSSPSQGLPLYNKLNGPNGQ